MAHPNAEERRKHRAAGTGVDYAEGIRLTDPRRMAVYFAKYGTTGRKDYQHHVPREWLTTALICDNCGREYNQDRDECPDCGCPEAELVDIGGGPGRFWGYRGLRPVLAIRQVTLAVGIAAGRVLRRWYRAKGLTKQVTVVRVEQATGPDLLPTLPQAQTALRPQPRLCHRQRWTCLRLAASALPRPALNLGGQW